MVRPYMVARQHVNSGSFEREEARRYWLGLWRDELLSAQAYLDLAYSPGLPPSDRRDCLQRARYWLFHAMDARRIVLEAGLFNGPHKPRVHHRRSKEWGEF